MIDFDDLDDAEDAGDDDQKASLVAAQRAWEEEKLKKEKAEEEARKAAEAAAARREQARAARLREEKRREEEERREEQRRQEETAKQERQQRPAQPSRAGATALEKAPAATASSTDSRELAQGCTAGASSSKSVERGASCAVDGDPNTRWTSAYADFQWLSVRLRGLCKLERVEVRWEAACAQTYQVQSSVDGFEWNTLAADAGSEGWVVTQLPADSAAASWVRIFCQKRATSFGFSIWELKVFGTETGTVAAAATAALPAPATSTPAAPPAAAPPPRRAIGALTARDSGGPAGAEGGPGLQRDARAQSILEAVGRPYDVLGLEPGATSSEIRRAYHLMALRFHPDKSGDEEVFRAIASAYKALTDARDQDADSPGWRDIEGQAVGPWQAHGTATNVVLFDTFGAPPWESRRLYTGCWGEALVRCWELSKGEPGKVRPPPRLLGQIDVGGFVNDLAAISPHGLVTAQSAGMIPQPGESLRVYDVNRTPFLRPQHSAEAIEDCADGGSKALEGPKARGEDRLAIKRGQEREQHEADRRQTENLQRDEASEKVFLHKRGCHALSLWPRPDVRGAAPVYVASSSKDTIGVSRIAEGGNNLDVLWRTPDPHSADVNALCWDSPGMLWSGGNDGLTRLWDVASGREEPVLRLGCGGGHVNRLEVWPDAGVMVCAHTGGISYMDVRVGDIIQHQYMQKPVKAMSCLQTGHPTLFMGIGNDLNQYDTRAFTGDFEKPKAVGQWTLRSPVVSINCTTSAKSHLLVAVGCEDGKVAAFDST